MTETLVWDASALHHFAKADRLDVLAAIAAPYRNVTTRVVISELAQHRLDPRAHSSWLDVVPVDNLDELSAYVTWSSRLGVTGNRNAGEATVFAWVQVRGGVALVDDGEARLLGVRAGLRVHGSLWLVAQAIRTGRESAASIAGLLRAVSAAGARYPKGAVSDFVSWARSVRLLE